MTIIDLSLPSLLLSAHHIVNVLRGVWNIVLPFDTVRFAVGFDVVALVF